MFHNLLYYILNYHFLSYGNDIILAYIDPGTGSLVLNILIAGVATAFFFLKGLFFKLFTKREISDGDKNQTFENSKISILSEGKQYWETFKPIVEALNNKDVKFQYFTLDVEDPALTIENNNMQAKFLGYGRWAYAKATNIQADVLLSTTPNIGTEGYPIRKPHNVKNLMHVFHSINDISMYRKGSLDAYDSVILVGAFQTESIRRIEKIRNLNHKELVPLGLPYLDELIKNKCNNAIRTYRKTVLIGSSWGYKGCLGSYGTGFIKVIAQAGFDVIVRPHPQSYISEPEKISKYKNELRQFKNITWDETISPSSAMNKADILVSDTSSIRFDYAFIYEKPVITLVIEADEMPGYERDYLTEIWTDKSSLEIGYVLDKKLVSFLPEYIEKVLLEFDSSRIKDIRKQTICNFGGAGEKIAEYLTRKFNTTEDAI